MLRFAAFLLLAGVTAAQHRGGPEIESSEFDFLPGPATRTHAPALPKFAAESVAIIDAHAKTKRSQRLFLYVALPAPHTPWLPTRAFRGKTAAASYGDFVLQVDDTVGQVFAALERNRMSDETLVVFSSDNGPVWYPQDVAKHDHRSTGPLRGMKGDAWEGGHRVPFIVSWPGHIAAGTTSEETICLTDMMATFAAVTGADLPADAAEDSFDLLPLLEGRASTKPVRDVTIHKQNASAIRAGRWKLITHLGSGGFSEPRRARAAPGGPRGQLYDLAADPGETANLWAARPDVVERLLSLLEENKRTRRSAPR